MSETGAAGLTPLVDLLFEDPHVGRCLVAPDGKVLRANREWLRATGIAHDRVAGADVVDLIPDARDAVLAVHARARAGHRVEVPRHVRRIDGRDTSWEGSIDPVPMGGGTGLLLTTREVSRDAEAQPEAELALRASEARFRTMADESPVVLWVTDANGDNEFVNRTYRDFFGVTFEEVEGTRWRPLIHPEDAPEYLEAFFGAVRAHEPFTGEARVQRKDGEWRWVATRAQPRYSETGAFLGHVGISLDVTDRKRAEEEARLSNQRKSEFLGVLSHELRNPLAPIRNSIYLLERSAPESEHAARAREVIRRQTEHLTRLTDDLLDVTRISRGKIVLQPTRVDLREIVRQTTDDLLSVFAQADVELHVDHVIGAVWVDADRTRIMQVLGNLLQNAVKFTPRGGNVSVTLAAKDEHAELRVRDDGVGMDPETIEHMFDPFVQAEMTLARTKGGLGLGLPLVRGLVELHGGTVEARSAGIGHGSEFLVRLRLAELGVEGGRDHHVAAEARTREILVIEDNLDAGDTLAEILELEGHRVRVARDGRSGLELAREQLPDVVLCDIGLPDIDGYEVARALRRDEALCATRLIALSGYAQPEDRQRARDAGFDAHIAKPPDVEKLMSMLATGS